MSAAWVDYKQKVFIVRPWNNDSASLYPYVMDGVEYIDSVIHALKEALNEGKYEVRLDEEVFIPGATLRENLQRELTDADMVIVVLDGLRPNVVYELGFAYGYNAISRANESKEKNSAKIVCLLEEHATVLVRNYYQNPMQVPTVDGAVAKIINPSLSITSAFSDVSDLLVLRYDRLHLSQTLTEKIKSLFAMFADESPKIKTSSVNYYDRKDFDKEIGEDDALSKRVAGPTADRPAESGATESSPESLGRERKYYDNLWAYYAKGDYHKVLEITSPSTTFIELKVRALSLMKLGRIYEAINTWKEIVNSDKKNGGTLLHLGICYYAISNFETAYYYFNMAKMVDDNRANDWIRRTEEKMGLPLKPA